MLRLSISAGPYQAVVLRPLFFAADFFPGVDLPDPDGLPAVLFFGPDFFWGAVVLGVVFFGVVFFEAFFVEVLFFGAVFFGADLLEGDFFLAGDFLPAACAGTLAPSLRASERPMATACLGLVTFFPLLPDFSLPSFISCMERATFFCAFFEYLAIVAVLDSIKKFMPATSRPRIHFFPTFRSCVFSGIISNLTGN